MPFPGSPRQSLAVNLACAPQMLFTSTQHPRAWGMGEASALLTQLPPAGSVAFSPRHRERKFLEELDSKQVHKWKHHWRQFESNIPERNTSKDRDILKIWREIFSILLRCYFYFSINLTYFFTEILVFMENYWVNKWVKRKNGKKMRMLRKTCKIGCD